ncbi:MAG: polyphosphate kinase 2 [Parvibaculum sp.]|uniref:polyphosphate kinase 2 n=1 Tax=Parvibaculum sp. TaxID=2024848 RepID=UPI003C749408
MAKKKSEKHNKHPVDIESRDDDDNYESELYDLQVELVKLQKDVIANNRKLLIVFEGRDGAGKDGTIKRITEHMSPRETRVVALSKPSSREVTQWYFQRYVPWFPAADEIVFFNRSWYNRAGVEHVMGFCTDTEYERFMSTVSAFEEMLIGSGIVLLKYYLDISKPEQKKRLAARHKDPLKQWKISPVDEAALKHWDDYTKARDAMFARTHTLHSPWYVVAANDKKVARLNVIRDILNRVDYEGKKQNRVVPDATIVFPFDPAHYKSGQISK